MKIEELYYSMPDQPVDEKNFDLEKWRQEKPMDYLLAMYLISKASNRDEVFKNIYQVARLYIPDTLYKYFSLSKDSSQNEKKFQTLLKRKIYMSAMGDFNDPFDGKAFYYKPDELKKIKQLEPHDGRLIDDFTAYVRGTSLTANGVNAMPMWAHYASNHAGFCVSYDMKSNVSLSGCTFPVQYTDKRLDVTSLMVSQATMLINEIEKQSKMGRKAIMINDLTTVYLPLLLFNIKHSSWSYEKEFRCTTGSTAKGMPYLDAIPKEIFIGFNCSSENIKEIEKIADYLRVPAHKMEFDEYASTFQLSVKD